MPDPPRRLTPDERFPPGTINSWGPIPGLACFARSETIGLIKIGWTKNHPGRRMATLNACSADPIILMGTMPGTIPDERAVHARFASLRARGEWFQPDPSLLAYIAEKSDPA